VPQRGHNRGCWPKVAEKRAPNAGGKDAVTSRIAGRGGRPQGGQLLADRLVAGVAVQAEVANALESLGQEVLDHSADEPQRRQGRVLNGLGLVVLVPVADLLAVVLLKRRTEMGGETTYLARYSAKPFPPGGTSPGCRWATNPFG